MRIDLEKLAQREQEFEHSYSPAEVDPEVARLTKPVIVKGVASLSDGRVRVKGSIEGEAQAHCDRCLKAVEVKISSTFDVLYISAKEYFSTGAHLELEAADMTLSVYENESIDLDEVVAEQILLETPGHVLCSSECKGLCPVCLADRNLIQCNCEKSERDPRWSALSDILEKTKSNPE